MEMELEVAARDVRRLRDIHAYVWRLNGVKRFIFFTNYLRIMTDYVKITNYLHIITNYVNIITNFVFWLTVNASLALK